MLFQRQGQKKSGGARMILGPSVSVFYAEKRFFGHKWFLFALLWSMLIRLCVKERRRSCTEHVENA